MMIRMSSSSQGRRRRRRRRRKTKMEEGVGMAVMITAIGTRLPGDYDNKHKTAW